MITADCGLAYVEPAGWGEWLFPVWHGEAAAITEMGGELQDAWSGAAGMAGAGTGDKWGQAKGIAFV